MRGQTLALCAAAVAVMALVALNVPPPEAPPPQEAAALETPSRAPGSLALGEARAMAAATPLPLPPSPLRPLPVPPHLDGVAIDGGVDLDRDGKPVLNNRLKNLFHHMLGLAEGDPERLPGVRESLKAHLLEEAIAPASQAAVLAAFDRYVSYLEAASKVQVASFAPDDLERAHQTAALLRRQHLGYGMAEGFFADQEALERYTVEQRRADADASLTPAQRQARLDALDAHLPAGVREPLEQSRKVVQLAQDAEKLRASGASQEAIDQLRAERFGPAAVERFRALDQERSQWNERLSAYRAERDAIRADASLARETQVRAIDEALARRFSGAEANRVRALDKATQ